MVFKTLLVVLVLAVLMEDSVSIKKTVEEEKEDREIAEKVNATLAEEKKKEDEENEKKRKEKNRKDDRVEEIAEVENPKKQDEACSLVNITCPVVDPCDPCPEVKDCPPCKECGPCPTVKPCHPCKPCGPCPVANSTVEPPSTPGCSEASMTVPMAMVVGAVASLFVTGVAATIGLLLRYVSPIVSGFLFLAVIIIIWYLSSQYPETARELGGRAVAVLREAAMALSHRVVEALQRHNNQVGFS
jgi:hypothetical protein